MRIGSGNLVARRSERKPVFFAAVALILVGGIAGTKPARGDGFDAGAPPSGPFSALVGVAVNGQLVCTGVLVDARLVVTAASCVPPTVPASAICLAISGVCTAAPTAKLDPSGTIAAFVLSADALATPITYGRGEDAPVAADQANVQGYEDPSSLVATITASTAATYTTILDSGSYLPTDLGSPLTFTPQASGDGTLTTAVYGVLVSLPAASDADAGSSDAVYARLDTIASSFLDPLVQGTRSDPYEGCR
jgi:hypothetical protein